MMEPLLFEKSSPGRIGFITPDSQVPMTELKDAIPQELIRKEEPNLPELSEIDVVRHFTRLSHLNHAVDTGFYPLGSCTMKYNPKVNEDMARLPGFTNLHPYLPDEFVQGALELMYETDLALSEIAGMNRFSLQPAAGAHGELTGMLIIKAYHNSRGDFKRTKVIVPDSAHGTNPATAALCGYETIEIPSYQDGRVNLEALQKVVGDDTAALMLTNPNTLGLFETNIQEIAKIVHNAGGLLYYDGANMNAIMGYARPGDMGFDVVHFNLHKTFSTPHGGGGPGSGPVGVKDFLVPFLPKPMVEFDRKSQTYYMNYSLPQSIGKIKSFFGNFGVIVKAYTYIKQLGGQGLKKVSENAVLNANYLMVQLAQTYHLPFEGPCKHEFIATPKNFKETGVRTLDIAKRLIDFGYHPPTVYFPLIVEEALMIEPTETENKQTLDEFAQALIKIAQESKEDPQLVKNSPYHTPITRLDETLAARKPNVRWRG